uniref:Importin beta-2 family protein n=1 Tax=Rhizophora mucronata TaxID=61149 RepID=A0A2P2QGF4_RHIMU
MEMCVSMPKKA